MDYFIYGLKLTVYTSVLNVAADFSENSTTSISMSSQNNFNVFHLHWYQTCYDNLPLKPMGIGVKRPLRKANYSPVSCGDYECVEL